MNKIPDCIILPRCRLQIVVQALAAACFEDNATAEFIIWKQFLEAHPEQQVFVISAQKERSKKRESRKGRMI